MSKQAKSKKAKGCLPSFALVVLLILACLIILFTKYRLIIYRNPNVNMQMNDRFIELIGSDVDLNSGITLWDMNERIRIIDPSQDPNSKVLIVFNHTNEAIVFPNFNFGLEGFWLNEESGKWERIKMHNYMGPQIILPPKIDYLSGEVNNVVSTGKDEIFHPRHQIVRLYISGIGEETGNVYGAYFDHEIIR